MFRSSSSTQTTTHANGPVMSILRRSLVDSDLTLPLRTLKSIDWELLFLFRPSINSPFHPTGEQIGSFDSRKRRKCLLSFWNYALWTLSGLRVHESVLGKYWDFLCHSADRAHIVCLSFLLVTLGGSILWKWVGALINMAISLLSCNGLWEIFNQRSGAGSDENCAWDAWFDFLMQLLFRSVNIASALYWIQKFAVVLLFFSSLSYGLILFFVHR